jgi:hypothetical protein
MTPKEQGDKIVQLIRGHEGQLFALTNSGRIFERVRNPRSDPNFSGRNPDQGLMWVEREGPLPEPKSDG